MRKLLLAVSALTVIVSGEVSAAKTTTSSTITYNGITYNYSSTSTCVDGTAALRLNRKWWCPVKSTTTSTSTPTAGTTTSGATSTTSTGTTSTSTSSTSSTTSGTWTTVANEYANFSLSSTQNVRFGSGSSWVEKTLSGTQACVVATFGSDPLYGTTKICQVMAGSTTSGATTTASTSAATSSTGSTSSSGTTTASTTTIAPVSYRANLSWTIPSTRSDGSVLALSELAGYEVYYTNESGTVSMSVPVSGGSITSAVVSNLTSGSYYFSISAIDTAGMKSSLSTVASVSIP